MNPCRCGHADEPGHSCRLGPACRERYQARVSGPILDRIDLRISVPPVTAADLSLPASGEGSATVRERVGQARERQMARFRHLNAHNIRLNAECPPALLGEVAALDAAGEKLLREASNAFGLSARGYHRVLRVARTLADLDGLERIAPAHIAEALACRGETARPGTEQPRIRAVRSAG
jgi:magnesium chelatase family protein